MRVRHALQVDKAPIWKSVKDIFLFFSHLFIVAWMPEHLLYALGYSPIPPDFFCCSVVPVLASEAFSLIPVPQAGKGDTPTGPLAHAFSGWSHSLHVNFQYFFFFLI